MPAIGNNPIVTVNGKNVPYQGIGHLRDDVTTQAAATQTKGNGFDEYIIATENAQNQPDRVLVYSHNLNFSFAHKNSVPQVTVDGRPGTMVHYAQEPNTFWKGLKAGVIDGFKNAFDNASSIGTRVMGGIAIAGGTAFVGGSVFTVATHGAGLNTVMYAVAKLAPTVAAGTGVAALAAVGLIVGCTAIKEAFAAMQDAPHTETIVGLTKEANPTGGPAPASNPPSVPVAPVAPVVNPVQPLTAPRPVQSRLAAAKQTAKR